MRTEGWVVCSGGGGGYWCCCRLLIVSGSLKWTVMLHSKRVLLFIDAYSAIRNYTLEMGMDE